ncbi:MAG: DUF4199 domain-containing protein [Bacteroidetes bacterium]|nr:DUF4199 domain-containing protein [Bacteroidota bacterium]
MKTSSPIRIAIILLLITIVWIAFQHIMGYNSLRHDIGQYTRMVTAFVFWIALFVVVRNEKKKNSSLTFMQGWKAGLLTSLVYSFGFTVIIILYQQFINPEFYSTIKAFTISQLQSSHASPEATDSALREVDMSYSGTPLSYLLLFVFSFIMGGFFSAIAAKFFKAKQPSGN